MRDRDVKPPGPSRGVRIAASVIIGLHFFAIGAAVTGSGNMRFPPPTMGYVLRFSKPINFYLQATFLTNPYRFYAPNPGPTNLIYFRLQYADKTVRWVEMNRRESFMMRMPYQRYLSLTMLLGGLGTGPDPTDRNKLLISPEAQVCLPSYARHAAITHPRFDADGQPVQVDYVDVYYIDHYILEPKQIRADCPADDLRSFFVTYFGEYAPDGSRLDHHRPKALRIPNVERLLAQTLIRDVGPVVRSLPRESRLDAVREMDLPLPWQRLIAQYPQLLDEIPVVSADVDHATENRTLFAFQSTIEGYVARSTRIPNETSEWDRSMQNEKPGDDESKDRGNRNP